MKVVEINVTGVKYFNRPRCTYVRVEAANSHLQREELCKRVAVWNVDGKLLCTHHAGSTVLPVLAKATK